MDFFQSDEFTHIVETLMVEHHVPGVSTAIVIGDSATAARGFGYASVERKQSCTPDTLFDIASSAKSFTAAAVALLVDDSKNHPQVQYDATMASLLPDDFVMPGASFTAGVTVEDVLSHRTGMASHDCSYMGIHAAQPDNARSVTRNLRNLPVAAPLRSRYLYCNMMYTVATHLVETESGMSFSSFLEDRFFGPLDMQSTTLQPRRARDKGLDSRIARGHVWIKDEDSYQEFDSPDCPEAQGAGSIMSSADDLIKWVKALMNRQPPINEKVYQGLTKMRSIVNPNARRLKPHTTPAIYAAGLEIYYYRGQMVIGHDGSIPGFASRFAFLPDKRLGVVVMGNSSGARAITTAVIRVLIDKLLQIPADERHLHSKLHKTKSVISRSASTPSSATSTKDNEAKGRNKASKGRKENKKPLPPQELPLEAYIGSYVHPGYRTITVEARNGDLFVDARDRGTGFTLTFEHKQDQKEYIAHLSDMLEGGDDPMPAQFVFDQGRAVRLGLDLEPAIRDLIWFDLTAAASPVQDEEKILG